MKIFLWQPGILCGRSLWRAAAVADGTDVENGVREYRSKKLDAEKAGPIEGRVRRRTPSETLPDRFAEQNRRRSSLAAA